jgi:hypothetical protein
MSDDKFPVLKITTKVKVRGDREPVSYFTRQTEHEPKFQNAGFETKIVQMTADEYRAIPTSNMAVSFFQQHGISK